jgi:hypothetical protein
MRLGDPRRLILVGALVTASGLGVAATAPVVGTRSPDAIVIQQRVGGLIVLAGWAILALGIHKFGRQA